MKKSIIFFDKDGIHNRYLNVVLLPYLGFCDMENIKKEKF
jgi:hypothetical protein